MLACEQARLGQGIMILHRSGNDDADRFELAIRKTFEVANQKRSPITASEHADLDLWFHILGADSFRLCKIGVGERRPPSCRLRCAASQDSRSCPAIAPLVFSIIFRSSRIDAFLR